MSAPTPTQVPLLAPLFNTTFACLFSPHRSQLSYLSVRRAQPTFTSFINRITSTTPPDKYLLPYSRSVTSLYRNTYALSTNSSFLLHHHWTRSHNTTAIVFFRPVTLFSSPSRTTRCLQTRFSIEDIFQPTHRHFGSTNPQVRYTTPTNYCVRQPESRISPHSQSTSVNGKPGSTFKRIVCNGVGS